MTANSKDEKLPTLTKLLETQEQFLELAGVEGLSRRRKLKQLEWQPRLSAHVGIKGLSRGLATSPPDRPPDAESRSPSAVATATGAEVESVLERTNKIYRKPNPDVQFAAYPKRRNSRGRR